MSKNLFFIDAESDGLYGQIISVAVIVTDPQFNVLDEQYYGIKKSLLAVKEPWVQENVIPILGEYESFDTEDELIEQVWNLWMKHRDNAYAIADVAYPVEMGLFRRCIMQDVSARCFLGPFPLLDLSSILYAKGYDPNVERQQLLDEDTLIKQHNALDDVRMSITIFKKLLSKGIIE